MHVDKCAFLSSLTETKNKKKQKEQRRYCELRCSYDILLSSQEVPYKIYKIPWHSRWCVRTSRTVQHTPSIRLTASDCSLTEGAAFVLCAFHGAIRQHLEVEAVSAIKPRDNALQLGLCRGSTGLNTH